MAQYINKAAVIAEIERIKKEECPTDSYEGRCKLLWFEQFLSFINTLEVKEVDLELENENNNTKIAIGTKIRSKVNPDIILSIISNDCHEDGFECSNGTVLSLKQIEKYYDIII